MAQLMPLPLTVSCFSKIQIGFTFLVPAHLGSPGQRAVKRVSKRRKTIIGLCIVLLYLQQQQQQQLCDGVVYKLGLVVVVVVVIVLIRLRFFPAF